MESSLSRLDEAGPADDEVVGALSDALLEARRVPGGIASLPEGLSLPDEAAAYAVQDRVARSLLGSAGPVLGWKVGAATPDATPFCAPLHRATLFFGDTRLPAGLCRVFGAEAEIVYRIGKDLPFRSDGWDEAAVRDAIASAHPAIEIFDTRFPRPFLYSRLIHLADQGNHGALVIGSGITDWASLHPVTEPVRLIVDGEVRMAHRGGNSAGDPIRLLVWLANHAAGRGMPLKAGDVVTTGSMTGTEFVPAGTVVRVEIGALAPVSVTIA
ncbi:2-oxopent-4-enoate hydratase [Gluconacetobacter sacchari DSM 12717]|uniref:2-keto-4-pentenoate hydratase n=3 Tax=Gluconacetobacter sacchari TaxID=92759 RepID=A0A7W4IEB8_9PROT|nr:fumarylacetoacetate hydrolase family protein [Gluconacetobacter sacchari]MBB2161300.1 2-keto-4-pentenoate hydratase [Gluconacetobacter sacchari]GBQ23605.1 2-oxopent-4-enoate hydratase [Gluconacetobacter sacchari DSM 12717]